MNEITESLRQLNVSIQEFRRAKANNDNARRRSMRILEPYIDKEKQVLVLTHKCDHAYSDTFGQEEDGRHFIKYNGQKISAKHDADMVSKDIPKELLIRKGHPDRIPPIFQQRALNTEDDYFYGGRVTDIQLIQPRNRYKGVPHPEPIYKVFFDPNAVSSISLITILQNVDLTPMWKSSKCTPKMEALIKYGFFPKNEKIDEGIIMCNYVKKPK